MPQIRFLWVVKNATPDSELIDVMFLQDLGSRNHAGYIIGTGLARYADENHSYYSDFDTALKDAGERLSEAGSNHAPNIGPEFMWKNEVDNLKADARQKFAGFRLPAMF